MDLKLTDSEMLNIGYHLGELAMDLSVWSQATFGTDDQRGPYGSLVHLEREAREAWDAAMTVKAAKINPGESDNLPVAETAFRTELADCLILWLDAVRRAGFGIQEIVKSARDKMLVNKSRQWPVPRLDNEPTEHIRSASE